MTPVQFIREFAIIVHLGPAIPAPLTPGHVDHEISIFFLVMDIHIRAIISTGTGRKGVYHSLRDEREVGTDPGLGGVEVFEGVLFLVLPIHVFLFVMDRIPPYVEEAVGDLRAADEE